jgi:hypothetical protein
VLAIGAISVVILELMDNKETKDLNNSAYKVSLWASSVPIFLFPLPVSTFAVAPFFNYLFTGLGYDVVKASKIGNINFT